MALFWELSLLRGDPRALQLLHVPLQLGMAALRGAAGEGTKPWRQGCCHSQDSHRDMSLLTL